MKTLVGLFIPVLFFTSCTQRPAVDRVLEKHRAQLGDLNSVRNISTEAACTGPEGSYTTRTASSFTSDYLLFRQEYDYKNNPFYAVVHSKEEGYGLDTTLTSQGPLSKPVIAVLKAHEFHELAMQVIQRYFQMQTGEDTLFFGVECKRIAAVDHLDYPVQLFFNARSGLMEGLSQMNPYQKGETIRVHFENWEKSENLMLFKRVVIRQGKKQQYVFEYKDIVINDPDFEKLDIR